jgi:LysR family transcriptional regulator, benzoate and cis,cis-muconate-responsive activator of ben and cat genes
MEIWQIKYFLAVADELNYGRAAAKLRIAQPSITRAVQGLEREIGVSLLLRDKRRVELTPAGRKFAADVRGILSGLLTSVRLARRVASGEAGTLTIGFEGSAAFAFIPQAVKAFHVRSPDVTFELLEMPTISQVTALKERRIDLGFIVPPVDDPDIGVEVVRSERLLLALPSIHRLRKRLAVTAADLADERLITPSDNNTCGINGAIRGVLEAAGVERPVAYVNDMQLCLCFVAAGEGVALVPASVADFARPGIAYRALRPAVQVHMAIARLKDAVVDSARDKFVESVHAVARTQDKRQRGWASGALGSSKNAVISPE